MLSASFSNASAAVQLVDVFSLQRRSSIPVEAKVLACLRMLGRGSCADEINELSSNLIRESTVHPLFCDFVRGMAPVWKHGLHSAISRMLLS